jgi:serine/threonine protein kinase
LLNDTDTLTSNQLEILNLMSSNIGTGIYRAPEIDSHKYDSKIDIYSLGIIILELFGNFTTQSEKIIILRKFQNEKNIKVLDFIKNEKIKNIIVETLDMDPMLRPCIQGLKKKINEIFYK